MSHPLGKVRNAIQHWKTGERIALAILVGALGAGAAIVLRRSIDWLTGLWLGSEAAWNPGVWVVLIPVVGGFLVGPIVYNISREARGHGVPEVMLAVSRNKGVIGPKTGIAKTIASVLSISSGGSVGREGPIVLIGSSVGSMVGVGFKLSTQDVRLLVACGAAAGVSATFNAPIAGALFASEVILRDFNAPTFTSVVLSSVTATAISQAYFGRAPAFDIPAYALESPIELLFYAGLGLLCAVLGVVFIRATYYSEDLFERLPVLPPWLRPALGGLAVGALGLTFPQIFGVGYDHVHRSLNEPQVVGLFCLFVLVPVKLLATTITLGSGGSGGILAPSLFLGATLGGGFGTLLHEAFPDLTGGGGAYATVGMAAMFSAAARAPLSAIVLIFEMTRDYQVILPLMIAVAIATAGSRALFRHSIYTLKLARRGLETEGTAPVNLLDFVTVQQAMTSNFTSVSPDTPVPKLLGLFSAMDRTSLPVLEDNETLYGIVTFRDVSHVIDRPQDKTVKDICTRHPLVCYPDETLSEAMTKLAVRNVASAPVVSRENPRTLVGMLERRDILQAASRASRSYRRHVQTIEEIRQADRDLRSLEVEVHPDSPRAGRPIRDLNLPEGALIISIRRGRRIVLPRGPTVLRPGDRISILVDRTQEQILRTYLSENRLEPSGFSTARL